MLSFFRFTVLFIFFFTTVIANGQYLSAGFDKKELEELVSINTTYSESKANKDLMPKPKYSKLVYQSPVLGLDNKWELWIKDQHIAIIGIRGSIMSTDSWLANLFAVQIPAKGQLTIAEDFVFNYKLAESPKAAVHAGYVFSTAFLVRDILPKIDSLYKIGIKDIIVTGHSQGGGLSYILAANLLWQQKDGLLPQDIRFKIYTTASPKPGNLYFAYDYDRVALDGWSYHVVNTEDWVPQTPFTVQTVDDLPTVNPVSFIQESIKKQSLFKRIFFKSIYNKIIKPPFKVVDVYQQFLGDYIGNKIKLDYPSFQLPPFSPSSEYVRVGRQILLYPDTGYNTKYNAAENPKNFMLHHTNNAYYYLLLHNNFK
ncbi:lipase family protein [Sphingobacterium rhinopitheci]|uniref:lipase family protein n=1 Tax=Sphingobacterium rhinopitheci TaxID=2781960 RepID=UPI001F528581|nr:lipase family protein [Sphingobacterium rhinopitheci]MCI0919812.1 lipase family protein [Sphingobacterium rhinopitheci]